MKGSPREMALLLLREVYPNLSLSSPPSTVPHAQRKLTSNGSSITEFLLLAFADTRELQLLHFWLFLGIYLAAFLGNSLIITAIACDHRLHTPMYFFLLNLSLLDLGSISTTVPKAMGNSLWDTRAISYLGCAAQVFFFLFLMVGEYCLLTVMAYDRYVAICKPLHYGTLLGSRACVHMAAAAWGSGFLYAVLHTVNTFSIPICQGNALNQFFCEIPQILKLSCSHSYLRKAGLLLFGFCLSSGCFVFIVLSYVQIFRAVLRIPSKHGRHKAFSMCLPHMAVASLVFITAMFAHLKPPSISCPSLNLVLAVLNSVVPPAVNPLIYSMRNQELKDAVRKGLISISFISIVTCGDHVRRQMFGFVSLVQRHEPALSHLEPVALGRLAAVLPIQLELLPTLTSKASVESPCDPRHHSQMALQSSTTSSGPCRDDREGARNSQVDQQRRQKSSLSWCSTRLG
ncbi:olfactory receptor 14J1-like [Sarcoramphus papa]